MTPSPFAERLIDDVRPILRSIQRVLKPPPFAVPSMPHRIIWSERLTNDPALRWLRGLLVGAFEVVRTESERQVLTKRRAGKKSGKE